MRIATRVLTAVVAVGLVVTTPLAQAAAPSADAGHSAHAKAPKAGKAKGGDYVAQAQRQLLHDIAKVSAAFDRSVKPSRVGVLTDTTEAALLTNAAADNTKLAAVRTAAAAADGSVDLRHARKDLKKLRTVNYVLVVNVLRKAERLLAGAVTGSTAAAPLSAVVTKALTVDASTDKAMLRELRADLKAAKAVLEAEAAAVPAPAPAA